MANFSRIMGCTTLAWLAVCTQTLRSQEITVEELEKATEIIKQYDLKAKSIDKYIALIQTTLTDQSLSSRKSTVSDSTYTTIVDIERKLYRYDTLTTGEKNDSGDLAIFDTSLITEVGQANWFSNGRRIGFIDLETEDKAGDKASQGKAVQVTPMELPIKGYSDFRERSSREKSLYDITKWKITKFEEDIRFAGLEVLVSEKDNMYMRILFSKADDGLPVESSLQMRLKRGEKELHLDYANTRTKWTTFGKHKVPQSVIAVQTVGNPKTGLKRTYEIRLKWSQFPNDGKNPFAFEADLLTVSSKTIREYVLDQPAGRF